MYFSNYFNVDKKKIQEYGAVDISLVLDLPLFIDPILIYSSEKKEYNELYNYIIKFFAFLYNEKKRTNSSDSIKKYIKSSEVKQNWLGFSKKGNEGNGLGKEFVNFLSTNIEFIFDNNDGIDIHYEKILLLYEKVGKDKISDLTSNLILDYLALYTERFALENIDNSKIEEFKLSYKFDFDKKVYKSKIYKLPFIYKNGVKEFVLLTPKDILRVDEPAICRSNLMNYFLDVCKTIENEYVRNQVNDIIYEDVNKYIRECAIKEEKESENIKKQKFMNGCSKALEKFPEIYNLFITLVENTDFSLSSELERSNLLNELCIEKIDIQKIMLEARMFSPWSSTKELADRIKFLKNKIENEDVYKIFYDGDTPLIKDEQTLQLLFKLTWYGTAYDFNAEGNNGGGEYDFKTSKGAFDKCIGEFKLASNNRLGSIFKQVNQYEKASGCLYGTSVYAIFGFDKKDEERFNRLINENKVRHLVNVTIFYIDCRKDNKVSASNLK